MAALDSDREIRDVYTELGDNVDYRNVAVPVLCKLHQISCATGGPTYTCLACTTYHTAARNPNPTMTTLA